VTTKHVVIVINQEEEGEGVVSLSKTFSKPS